MLAFGFYDYQWAQIIFLDDRRLWRKNLHYSIFFMQAEISKKYPGLWRMVRKLLIAFQSSYFVEKTSSVVVNLLTTKRTRLNITERGNLRLFLTKLKPNTDNLLSIYQVHPFYWEYGYFVIVFFLQKIERFFLSDALSLLWNIFLYFIFGKIIEKLGWTL